MITWRLVVSGIPRTKKTSNVLARAGKGGRMIILPSPQFRKWQENAVIAIQSDGHLWPWPRVLPWPKGRTTLIPPKVPLAVCAVFYREADRGDAVGFYQGLADLLQHRGIVANDVQFRQWDGSRLEVDRASPRVEITLTALAAVPIWPPLPDEEPEDRLEPFPAHLRQAGAEP